jgi:hypothetical protein
LRESNWQKNLQQNGMRESLSRSNPERQNRVSLSKIPIRSTIAAVVSTANPIDSDEELATDFQCFTITNDSIPRESTPKPTSTLYHLSNNMNDSFLAQIFLGENFEPIMVTMYIESIEERVDCSGRDAVGRERFCRLAFFNDLKGPASQWFQKLDIEVQKDWARL